MLVYRAFTRVCSVLSTSIAHFLSIVSRCHAFLDKFECGFGWCDYLYLRSPFLQTHCNYRLNYRECEKGLTGELLSLVSKCGINYEFHPDVDRSATSNSSGRVDLYRLTRMDAPNQDRKRTVVLIHGILQRIDVFICGGKSGLASQLLFQGCDVWLLHTHGTSHKRDSISATAAHPGAGLLHLVEAEACVPPTVQGTEDSLTCENLNAVAKYIEDYHTNPPKKGDIHGSYDYHNSMAGSSTKCANGSMGSTGVCWIGHSTACRSILAALTYSSSVHASDTAELRKRTSGAVLLSPVITLTHLNRYARNTNVVDSTVNAVPSLLLEVLLHSPDSAYKLFGTKVLLQSLQQVRDICTVPTFGKYVIAPLCRCTFGWTFRNIAPHRRKDLLQYLLQPTATNALISLLYASQGDIHVENAYLGSIRLYHIVQNVYTFYRWLWRCTLFTADVSVSLANKILGVDISVVVYERTMSDHPCTVAHDTASNSSICLHSDKNVQHNNNITSALPPRTAAKINTCRKPRIISFVGSEDALSNIAELKSRLVALSEQYSFDSEVRVIAGYEHMDTLWADTAPELIFNAV